MTPVPTPTPRFHELDEIPEPPDADLIDLVLRFRDLAEGTPLLAPDPGDEVLTTGRIDTFSVLNLIEETPYDIEAELRFVSPHAYWYFDVDVDVDTRNIVAIAARFEDEVYRTVTDVLGIEWAADPSPGQRTVLLHTPVDGAAAYYSSKDDFSTDVHPDSNERKILYLDTALRLGSESYYGTVAHELQHAIHQRSDPSEETWVNEGMAEVARNLTGRDLTFARSYLLAPNSSVVNWASRPKSVGPNYGASSLFLAYLLGHYGGNEGAKALLDEPADGINGVEAYLQKTQQGVTFDEVFENWTVANLFDLDSGLYSFPNIEVGPPAISSLVEGDNTFSLPQYGVAYVRLEGDLLTFEGGEAADIVPYEEGCWWSNAGDSINTTLTRSFDLTDVSEATLRLRLWHNIEKSWDYAYVTVSSDGGASWTIVPGGLASPGNPVGNALGPGYTGATDGYVWDIVDLSAFAGSEVLVRLEYVTDESTTADGLCVSEIRLPELDYDYDVSSGSGGWTPVGFFRVSRPLEQRFSVQVVAWDDGRKNVGVQKLTLDEQNSGQLELQELRERFDEIVVVVVPMTRETRQEATFNLREE
ncbi:MAG: Bacillopeptidase F, M6 metalloprotease family [Chloroflexi bacterium]|nr:MAG: Bacillopeptidase F, M6 metalloprotease family [Chloroflexota bacterium]